MLGCKMTGLRPVFSYAAFLGTVVALAFTLASCVFSDKNVNKDPQDNFLNFSPVKNGGQITTAATLGPDDVFEIRVYKEPDLSGIYRVDTDGFIVFPMLGKVKVEGMTPNKVSEYLEKHLANYLVNPYVSVYIKEFNSKKIFVFGQVGKPGTFRYEDNMTIIQAVTLAGGLTPRSASNRTIVTRIIEGKEYQVVVPVKDIGEGKKKNFLLIPGDIVFVPDALF